ncbi:MAG: V-type ATP synthase subunit K [Candidatus Ancaeobacter aquaticus]|nr:V-type ATP synthase subunit K [Candidatus Ancaeobacter aquaticus]
MEFGLVFALAGSALVIVLGGIGSSIGVGLAGQAAGGVITEDPDKFGSMIPLVGLPGTQGFYGLLIGFMVIIKLKLLTDAIIIPDLSTGLQIFVICVSVGFVEMISSIHQGKVAVASVGLVAKRPEELGKGLILPAFVEIYAVLGLVAAFLLLLQVVKV